MSALDRALTIDDLKEMARRRVPKQFFDYIDSGAYTEGTYGANEDDFKKITFRQRVAVNLENRNLELDAAGPAGEPAGRHRAGRLDRHDRRRRRDQGGAGGGEVRHSVHALDHGDLLDRGRRREHHASRSGSSSM